MLGVEIFFLRKVRGERTKYQKTFTLYIVGDEIFVKKIKNVNQIGKKCPVIWCRVNFLTKSLQQNGPNGKKVCTYMVGGKNNETQINTGGLFAR